MISGATGIFLNPVTILYTNDGLGNFIEVTGTPFTNLASSSIGFSDIDGDTDLDVIISGLSGSPVTNLYINDNIVNTTDLSNTNNFDFTLSPNPTIEDRVYVNFEAEESSQLTIKVSTADGRLLIQQNEAANIGVQTFPIDISTLQKGIYFMELNDGEKRGITKFMVQ